MLKVSVMGDIGYSDSEILKNIFLFGKFFLTRTKLSASLI
jgi:hypothetical protein